MKGFAGELKGLPVSSRNHQNGGATEKVATVDARLKGFARELKGSPMR